MNYGFCKKAIKINPRLPQAYINLGTAYFGLKKYSKAIENYNQAIKVNPKFSEAYSNRGAIYAFLQQNDISI